MPKVGRNIYKRKDGRWEGRYYKGRKKDGRIIYGYVYGKSCSEVKRRLTILTSEELKPVENNIAQKYNATFSDIADQWLSIISLKVKSSTYVRYITTLELHILPIIGAVNIQTLSAVDISKLAIVKLENGRIDGKGGLSTKTVRDILTIIKAVINYAYREHIISKDFTIFYPKQTHKTLRVLSRQEQDALETVLAKDMNIHKLGILLCLYTGLRVGEVCALQWQDISIDFSSLSVRRTLQRIKNIGNDNEKTKILVDTPKSLQSARDIPIPKFLIPYLRQYTRKSNVYLLSTDKTLFTEPRTMQNHFFRYVREANIKDANYHSLRHTFATRCIEAGVDIKSLSELLGHSSVNITLDRYVHSSFDQKRVSINKLEQYVKI